ncbi:MAG: AMP-binding protein, partial [bacterium]|nr:AMP-binding protein [bacterium]
LLLEDTGESGWLKCIKELLVGGEAFPPGLFKRLKEMFWGKIYNVYGPTETTIWSTSRDLSQCSLEELNIGKPVANTTVYILDRWLKPVPIGATGELHIGGAGVSSGYLNNPELTIDKFLIVTNKLKIKEKSTPFSLSPIAYRPSSLYNTGDLARWLKDGNIEFLGRMDQQVKLRGFRIELQEIENRLLKHNEIKEAVVIDREKEDGDKYLCAYIVAGRKARGRHCRDKTPIYRVRDTLDTLTLRDYLAGVLPGYMIPSYFVNLDKIPLTPNGKIDRKALPDPGDTVGDGALYTAPGNNVEKQLVTIWSEVLAAESGKLGIDANFFQLGGHSLKATILVSKIHKKLAIKFPLGEVFNTPTIRGQALYIKKAAKDKYASLEALEKRAYYALSSAQKRLYFLQQLDPQSTAYNMPLV